MIPCSPQWRHIFTTDPADSALRNLVQSMSLQLCTDWHEQSSLPRGRSCQCHLEILVVRWPVHRKSTDVCWIFVGVNTILAALAFHFIGVELGKLPKKRYHDIIIVFFLLAGGYGSRRGANGPTQLAIFV